MVASLRLEALHVELQLMAAGCILHARPLQATKQVIDRRPAFVTLRTALLAVNLVAFLGDNMQHESHMPCQCSVVFSLTVPEMQEVV